MLFFLTLTFGTGTEENKKTKLCTRYQSPDGCKYGDRCNFAHGTQELRSIDDNRRRLQDEGRRAPHPSSSPGGPTSGSRNGVGGGAHKVPSTTSAYYYPPYVAGTATHTSPYAPAMGSIGAYQPAMQPMYIPPQGGSPGWIDPNTGAITAQGINPMTMQPGMVYYYPQG